MSSDSDIEVIHESLPFQGAGGGATSRSRASAYSGRSSESLTSQNFPSTTPIFDSSNHNAVPSVRAQLELPVPTGSNVFSYDVKLSARHDGFRIALHQAKPSHSGLQSTDHATDGPRPLPVWSQQIKVSEVSSNASSSGRNVAADDDDDDISIVGEFCHSGARPRTSGAPPAFSAHGGQSESRQTVAQMLSHRRQQEQLAPRKPLTIGIARPMIRRNPAQSPPVANPSVLRPILPPGLSRPKLMNKDITDAFSAPRLPPLIPYGNIRSRNIRPVQGKPSLVLPRPAVYDPSKTPSSSNASATAVISDERSFDVSAFLNRLPSGAAAGRPHPNRNLIENRMTVNDARPYKSHAGSSITMRRDQVAKHPRPARPPVFHNNDGLVFGRRIYVRAEMEEDDDSSSDDEETFGPRFYGFFKCVWRDDDGVSCGRLCSSNVDMMAHAMAHLVEEWQENVVNATNDAGDAAITMCPICLRTAAPDGYLFNPRTLHCHIRSVHLQPNPNSNVCFVCDQQYTDVASLRRHMYRGHSELEAPYTCPICPYFTSVYDDVYMHFYEKHRFTYYLVCPLCFHDFGVNPFVNAEVDRDDRPQPRRVVVPDAFLREWKKGALLQRTCYWENTLISRHVRLHMTRDIPCSHCRLHFVSDKHSELHALQHESLHLSDGYRAAKQRRRGRNMGIYGIRTDNLQPRVRRLLPVRRAQRAPLHRTDVAVMSSARCVECLQPMTKEHHFHKAADSDPLRCRQADCEFRTRCRVAYRLHSHSTRRRGARNLPLSQRRTHYSHTILRGNMEGLCACGYRSVFGALLAEHAASCEESGEEIRLVDCSLVVNANPQVPTSFLTLLRLRCPNRLEAVCEDVKEEDVKPSVSGESWLTIQLPQRTDREDSPMISPHHSSGPSIMEGIQRHTSSVSKTSLRPPDAPPDEASDGSGDDEAMGEGDGVEPKNKRHCRAPRRRTLPRACRKDADSSQSRSADDASDADCEGSDDEDADDEQTLSTNSGSNSQPLSAPAQARATELRLHEFQRKLNRHSTSAETGRAYRSFRRRLDAKEPEVDETAYANELVDDKDTLKAALGKMKNGGGGSRREEEEDVGCRRGKEEDVGSSRGKEEDGSSRGKEEEDVEEEKMDTSVEETVLLWKLAEKAGTSVEQAVEARSLVTAEERSEDRHEDVDMNEDIPRVDSGSPLNNDEF